MFIQVIQSRMNNARCVARKKSDMSTYYSTLIMTEKYGSAVIVPRKCSVIM